MSEFLWYWMANASVQLKGLRELHERTRKVLCGVVLALSLPLFLFTASSAVAATQGPLNPASCANNAGTGTVAWSSTAFPATVKLKVNFSDVSNYLLCTGYGFSIPAGSTIDGITVTINRSANQAGCCQDTAVRIVKTGAIGATDRSNAATWPTTAGSQNYGNAADLWGNAWTVADINAGNFGLALAATANNGNGQPTLTVNSVAITVTYHTPAAPTVAKAFAPTTVPTQVSSTLTITLSNSNATAITSAAFTDAYPAGLVNATPPGGSTTCAGGTVTAVAGQGTQNIYCAFLDPADIVTMVADAMAVYGNNGYLRAQGNPLVIFSPGHAKIFAVAGWSKERVKAELFERTKIPRARIPRRPATALRRARRDGASELHRNG